MEKMVVIYENMNNIIIKSFCLSKDITKSRKMSHNLDMKSMISLKMDYSSLIKKKVTPTNY